MQPHPPIHSRRFVSLLFSCFFSLALLWGLLGLFQPTSTAAGAAPQTEVVVSPLASAATQVTTNSINLETSAYWTAGDDVDTGAVDWGDMDGDGDLDLAAAIFPLGIRIYLNLGDDLQTITDAPLSFDFGMDATDVAWGDVDGDGDLDLAAADKSGSEKVYLNIGGTINPTAGWVSSEGDGETYSLAWGDVDGDGDLDLAVGNTAALSRLYLNVGGMLQTAAAQNFGDSNTQSVAWGDVDNDGDLDLALANACGASKVYFNSGGNLTTAVPWSSATSHCAVSAAWGDMDGDGDLDLAIGNRNAPNKVYRNVGGTLQTPAVWAAPITETTKSVAWGDVDMDGDLDLAVGNDQTFDPGCNCNIGGEDKIYLNNGDMLGGTAAWQSSYDDKTHSLAWGDIDGDGDLDLAAGNYANSNRVYLNRGNLLQGAADDPWQSAIPRKTTSLAWGDVDGDGDLDLALGNEDQQNQVLRNDGLDELGRLQLSPFWTAPTSDTTRSLAWGDVDSDGDLDLAVGNYNQQNKVYQNNGLNGLGNLQMSLLWDAAAADYSNGLAWGDVDGDGDLDLAVANGQYTYTVSYTGRPNQLYLNQGGTLAETAAWTSAESDSSLGLAWGDVDGDGDLDLAVNNYAPESARLYLNQGGTLDTTGSWSAGIEEMTFGLAWGDMDGDGDLDLAIANRDAHPGRVYLNDSGTLQQINDFPPTFGNGDSSLAVAWGDVDGDGDLDLAAANEMEVSVVFVNEHGRLDDKAEWNSANEGTTTAAAWGDANGDGRLDLALSSYGGSTWVYLNETTPELLFDNQPATNLVIDLEQSQANFYATAEIHDGTIPFTYTLYHPTGDSAWSVQGYYSLDGGDNWQPALASSGTQTTNLAINTPITLTTALSFDGMNDYVFVPDSNSLDLTNQMTLEAWVKINAFDRPWQTIIAKGDSAYRIHRLNTTNTIAFGTRIGASNHDLAATTNIADGQWHHIAATFNGTTKRIYIDGVLENSASVSGSVNVTTQPFAIGENLQAANRFWHGTIDEVRLWNVARSQAEIQADRNDSLNGNETGLIAYWPLNEGAGGATGDATGNNNNGSLGNGVAAARPAWVAVETSFAGTHLYTWDVYGSGFLGHSDNVIFRLQAASGSLGGRAEAAGSYDYSNTIPGPFLRPFVSSQTFPLRVRGTQIQVLSDTVPVANAVVYLLPAGQSDGATPLKDLAGTPYQTDSQGYLQGRGQLTIGDDGETADTLYALLPITATDSYTLYYTSASPTEDGLAGQVVSQTGTIQLVVSADHPLILFNLDISLEWDARNDDLFLEDLEDAIGRTAQTLFDVSDGQMALGDVTIYQDGENWLSSDVVLLASNGIRPRASMGGLVDELTNDVVSATLTISNAYGPGQIRIGPNWDPFGQNQAELTEDWWRAFAHELSHYLLYLPDNYLGLDEDGALVGVDCQGSFMTNTYDGSYSEYLTSSQWAGDCLDTVAAHTTGRVDWQTITAFYPWLVAPAAPLAGPDNLPLSLLQVDYIEPDVEDTVLAAGNLDLRDSSGDLTSRPSGQGYLIQTQGTTADLSDDEIVALGSTGGGGDRIYVRGSQPGDRVCVFDFSDDPPWLGCADNISDGTASVTIEEVTDWQPNIQVRATTSTTWAVTVTLLTAAPSLNVQIYPSYDSATSTVPASAPWSAMTPLDAGNRVTYTQIITLDYPVFEGWVRVWNPSTTSPVHQALSQVFLSPPWGPRTRDGCGGGCADSRAWGSNDRALGAPVASGDGQVTIFNLEDIYADTGTAALQSLHVLPNLPVWLSAVGQGYRFTADAVYSRTIDFDYLQRDVPDGYEYTLHVYYTADEGQTWQRLATDLDTSDNSASAVMPNNAVQGQGIYALLSTVDMPTFEPGWNQFGYPLPGSRAITIALAAIEGAYSSVYYQEADSWRLYDQPAATQHPELAGLVNDLAELEFGRSYWLSATESITLYLGVPGDGDLSGYAPEFVPALPPATFYGWITPTAGFAPTTGMAVTAAINGVTCGQTTIQSWQGKLAYRLMVAADNGNGCGTAGQTVVFAVGGQVVSHDMAWDTGRAWYNPLSSVAAAANLAVSQLLMPAAPEAGKGIAVLVTVTNNGPLPAAGVLLTNTLPAGATYLLGTEGVNYCSHSAGTVSCNLGAIAAYGSKTAVIGFSVSAAGSYSQTAQVVASPNNDPVMGNNSHTLLFTAGAPTLLSQVGSLLGNSPTAIVFLWPFAFLLLVTGNVLWQRRRRSG